ncbi:MAG: MBL fold metallo-hydrolase, partial [Myxococcales bacterium]|nr:MBL fold metallo-hydrolase [Myxococcales bacterium]
ADALSGLAHDPLVVGRPASWELIVAFLCALLGVLATHRKLTRPRLAPVILGMLLLLAVGHYLRTKPPPSMEVFFIPVGQGDASLVRLPSGENILIDAGGSAFVDTGERAVVPALHGLGISSLSLAVLSHGDLDHVGGAASVFTAYPPGELWYRDDPSSAAQNLAVSQAQAAGAFLVDIEDAHRRVEVGGAQVDVLVPGQVVSLEGRNDNSLVVRIATADGAVLFPGDIERDGERVLSGEFGGAIAAQVLKVPHHGSRTSSSSDLLRAVRPSVGVLSLGEHNRFGFPHREAVERLEGERVVLLRTDLDGLIRLRFFDGRVEAFGNAP